MFKKLRAIVAFTVAAALAFSMVGCSAGNYKPELKSPTVSTPTIGQDGTLRVGVNTAKSPLAGMGNDKIIGIDVDVAAAIADDLGLALSIVDVGNSPQDALSKGTVDIVMGIDSTDTPDDFWISEQYLSTGVVLFAAEGSNAGVPAADSNPKVAAQTSSKSAWAVTNDFGEDALMASNDLAGAIDSLKSGSAQYLASDAVIGLYAANRRGVNVDIVALMDTASGYCIGVSKQNVDLQSVISQTLASLLSDGTIGVIESKWLGGPVDLTSAPKIEASKKASTNASKDKEKSSKSSSSSKESSSSSESSSDEDSEAS